MTERKSIMLYLDSEQQWQMLSDEQAGVLIKSLIHYSKTGESIDTDDGMIMMAFSFMSAQIDRDGEKYEKRCEKNRQIAIEREERRKAAVNTNVHERARTCTNVTDTDTDTDTDIDIDTDINNKCADKQRTSSRFVPPTIDEVRAYCQERGNSIDPQAFCDFYEAKGWIVGKTKMKSWKAAVRTWEQRESEMPTVKPQNKQSYQNQNPARSSSSSKIGWGSLENSSIDLNDVETLMNPY